MHIISKSAKLMETNKGVVTVVTNKTRQVVFRAGLPVHCDAVIAAMGAVVNTSHIRLLWETIDEIIPLNYHFKQPITVRVVSVKDHIISIYYKPQHLLTMLYCSGRSVSVSEVMERIVKEFPQFDNGRLVELDAQTPVLHREVKAGESLYVQSVAIPRQDKTINVVFLLLGFAILFWCLFL